jgi:cephalosporin hydroxylase
MTLKQAAQSAHLAMRERIKSTQRGVPTFFDNYFMKILKRLLETEEIHNWDVASPRSQEAEHTRIFRELGWIHSYLANQSQGRFVPFAARRSDERFRSSSDVAALDMVMSQGTSRCLEWKGSALFKSVYDFALIPMLMSELKPATILEIGSGTGASAGWMADLARSTGLETSVYSVDIKPASSTHPGVKFLVGDCMAPATLFSAELLAQAPHPWLVLEDAHANVAGVLTYLDQFVRPADYLFVEDSGGKVAELEKFMETHANRYLVDTRYTDFFGRNATCAPNSIFVKS